MTVCVCVCVRERKRERVCVRVRAHTHVSRVFQPLGTWPEAILDSHSIPPFLFSTKDVFERFGKNCWLFWYVVTEK